MKIRLSRNQHTKHFWNIGLFFFEKEGSQEMSYLHPRTFNNCSGFLEVKTKYQARSYKRTVCCPILIRLRLVSSPFRAQLIFQNQIKRRDNVYREFVTSLNVRRHVPDGRDSVSGH